MRNELEEIERIEKYLSKEMNPQDLQLFEEELKNNISLQKKVNQQKILLKGIRKKAFKEVAKSSFKKYKLIKKLWWGGIGLGVVLVAVSTFVFLNKDDEGEKENVAPIVAPIQTPVEEKEDTIEGDSVTTLPSTMPVADAEVNEKPKTKKKEEIKKDSSVTENVVAPKMDKKNTTTKSLKLNKEEKQDFLIKQ